MLAMNFRNVSMHPSKKDVGQINKERAQLLWRLILRHPQFDKIFSHKKIGREVIIRTFTNSPDKYLSNQPFDLLSSHLNKVFRLQASDLEALQKLTLQVAVSYGNELSYIEGQHERVSFDIMFLTLDLVKLNKTADGMKAVLEHMGEKNSNTSITATDRSLFVKYGIAYTKMYQLLEAFWAKEKNIDLIKSRRDEIITQIARLSPEVTLTALDSMFRRLTAQMMLNLTHENCSKLIQTFIAEISLGPDQAQKIIKHIPLKTPFSEFYQQYVKAIQSLSESSAEDKSEEGLLRFLLNYYNIQIDSMASYLSK